MIRVLGFVRFGNACWVKRFMRFVPRTQEWVWDVAGGLRVFGFRGFGLGIWQCMQVYIWLCAVYTLTP